MSNEQRLSPEREQLIWATLERDSRINYSDAHQLKNEIDALRDRLAAQETRIEALRKALEVNVEQQRDSYATRFARLTLKKDDAANLRTGEQGKNDG